MTRWKRIIIVALAILGLSIVACFLFRDHLLQLAFSKAQARMHDSYHASLKASSVSFSGLNNVVVKRLLIQPDSSDVFLQVNEAEVNVSLVNLLRAKIALDKIKVNGVVLTLYNEEGRNNISFLRSRKKEHTSTTIDAAGFNDRVADWEDKVFTLLHTAFEVHEISISYQDSTDIESIYIPSFTYDLRHLSGLLINPKNSDTIAIDGEVLKRKTSYQCTIRHLGSDTICLPFLDRDRKLRCRFHEVTARLDFDNSAGTCKINVDASLDDFHINHWRLSRQDVVLSHSRFKGLIAITDKAIELDSSSVIDMGSAGCHLFARYDLQPDTTITLGIHMAETPADSFFQALPQGMFGTLQGISCAGTLTYDLDFSLHTNNPDSLLFYSAMKQKGLHVQHYGEENYSRINGPFVYDAYDKDVLVRRITVGPDNPFYTPFDQMSAYLPQCVLQAEDPSFMQHRGFYLDAFRESIAKNYKEHRFARGGSTISMQLVKNVFLSKDKTVSRKAEEALIVYLIENLGLVFKQRMLEVYLNVIEWGPNVYGVGEAAYFYFDKKPSQLTLQESLFLASIIPRPKSFQYQFDKEGQLRQSMGSYFNTLATRMVWRGVLEPNDTIGLQPRVTLKGGATHYFAAHDSIPPVDEIEPEDN